MVFLKFFSNSQENTYKLRPANLLKKRLLRRCFFTNFARFFTSERLLLKLETYPVLQLIHKDKVFHVSRKVLF